MNTFPEFLLKNFFLFCVALGVIFMVIRSYRTKRIVVLMPIFVVSFAVLLSFIYFFELMCADNQIPFWPIFFSALGFILRPLVLYFFMRMTISDKRIMIASLIIIKTPLQIIIYFCRERRPRRSVCYVTCSAERWGRHPLRCAGNLIDIL